MSDRLAELEANHAAYERILGQRTYREVADELADLRKKLRRCETNFVGGMGECIACEAAQGEHCLLPSQAS